MDKVIIFKNEDGTCGVVMPSPDAVVPYYVDETIKLQVIKKVDGVTKLEDCEEVVKVKKYRKLTIEEIAEQSVPNGKPYRIADANSLPKDRYFRNAWTDDNPTETVDICLEKARNVQMEHIRKARAEKFIEMGFKDKLHPELEAQLSEGVQKQLKALRDLPKTTDLSKAKNLKELKAIWPKELESN